MQKRMATRIIIVMKSGAPLLGLAKAILIIIMAIVNFMSDHTHLSPIIHAFDGSILWLVREKGRYRIYSVYKITYLWCKLRFHYFNISLSDSSHYY